MPNPTFVIQTSSDFQTYFTLRAANNEVILTSELYRAVDSAHSGIESVRQHAPSDANYVKRDSAAGEAYFVLRAANNQVIGTSEMYASKQMRDKGIEAVQAAAPTAVVEDRR
jgi:uncharacterized protein YegP (UPF0339 family)